MNEGQNLSGFENLVVRLAEKTASGSVTWVLDGSNSFRLRTNSGMVRVYSRDGDGLEPYVVDLLNRGGDFVTGASSEPSPTVPTGVRNAIASLYLAARSSVVNSVAEGILADLDKDDEVPF